jgi:hypothetical protein
MSESSSAGQNLIVDATLSLTGTDEDFELVQQILNPLLRQIVEARVAREAQTEERPNPYSKVYAQVGFEKSL